jgi:methyl-accepting chemotaxis protein
MMKTMINRLPSRLSSVSKNLKKIIDELNESPGANQGMSDNSLNPLSQLVVERIQRITAELDELVESVRSKTSDTSSTSKQKLRRVDYSELIGTLKANGRDSSVQMLSTMKQTELGAIYVQLGGASRDRTKPKEWLIERILFKMFDFQSGHELLRGN